MLLGPYSYYQLITLSEQPLCTRGEKLNWIFLWKEKRRTKFKKKGTNNWNWLTNFVVGLNQDCPFDPCQGFKTVSLPSHCHLQSSDCWNWEDTLPLKPYLCLKLTWVSECSVDPWFLHSAARSDGDWLIRESASSWSNFISINFPLLFSHTVAAWMHFLRLFVWHKLSNLRPHQGYLASGGNRQCSRASDEI